MSYTVYKQKYPELLCPHCRKRTSYQLHDRMAEENIKGIQFAWKEVFGVCNECGKEIFFAVNAGAGRLYEKQSGVYRFPAESRRCGQRVERSREELIEYLTRLTGEYPISLLEDPLYREDREGIQELEKKLEDREDCEKKTVLGRRSVMIDPGEIYTLTELSERVREVTEQGKGIILCRQRKETEDAALVDAAVAFGIGQMKLGSPGCLEAAVKYNRLLKLEEKLGKSLGTDCP